MALSSETNYTKPKETTNIFGFSDLETENRTACEDEFFRGP